jgi:hypothetical protein
VFFKFLEEVPSMGDFVVENYCQGIQLYGIGRSVRLSGNEYRKFHWTMDANVAETPGGFLNPKDVCNFSRATPRSSGRDISCIMCGASDVSIPSQNKKVCKNCDSTFWLWQRYQVVFKFCKGCKNFCFLADFDDRPEGTKCTKCRQRSRDWYHSKKGSDDNSSPTGSLEELSPHSNLPTPAEKFSPSISTSALPDNLNPDGALPPVPTLVSGDVLAAKRGQQMRKRSFSALEDVASDGLRSVNHRPYKKLVFSPVATTPGERKQVLYATPASNTTYFDEQNQMILSSCSSTQTVPLFATPYHAPSSGVGLPTSSSGKSLSLSAFSSSNSASGLASMTSSSATSLLGFPTFPLHQVTPEGYAILAPPNSAISSSRSSRKRVRKSTPISAELARSQSTPQHDSEYRLHRATLRSASEINSHANGTASVSHRSRYGKNDDGGEGENDPELERLTSETFDRLVSAHEATDPTSSWLNAQSLLLSCRKAASASNTVVAAAAASSGMPPRLSVLQPSHHSSYSLQRSPPHSGSVSEMSRPSTACSLTYSAANSPSSEQRSQHDNDDKENIPISSVTSSCSQSPLSCLQQQPRLQLLQDSLPKANSGVSGIAILKDEVQSKYSERDELEDPKQTWQYDPKHNPLALLANFSDDLFLDS